MLDGLSGGLERLSGDPALQGLVAGLATFILEDPVTIGAGLLVADGKMAFVAAFFGVAGGIAVGDVGLYAIGRFLGPKVVRWRIVRRERVDAAQRWFGRNLLVAILLSRFVPGMRLPTYVGAGLVGASFWRFVVIAVGASVVWTFALLHATIALGEAVFPMLGRFRWPAAGVLLVILLFGQRSAVRAVTARADARDAAAPSVSVDDATPDAPVLSRFELWPPWIFYLPVAAYALVLAVRYRGLTLPTAANPAIRGGGFVGESKSAILDLVSGDARRFVATYRVFERDALDPLDPETLERVETELRTERIAYPFVAKPDVGQRGLGVQRIVDRRALEAYLRAFPAGGRVVFQAMAGGEPAAPSFGDSRLEGVREAGVLYWRDPEAERGEVFSVTLKRFPEVIGDGDRTLARLIEDDPRASRLRELYFARHRAALDRVPGVGERVPLVFSGNHCQGAVFIDGRDFVGPKLVARFDAIAASMREFWYGRFDVRFDDVGAFLEGEDVQIVEVNGAGAEATHIWDARARLIDAYRTLFEQFDALYRIGAANRARGHRPLSFGEFLRDWRENRRVARTYPSTH